MASLWSWGKCLHRQRTGFGPVRGMYWYTWQRHFLTWHGRVSGRSEGTSSKSVLCCLYLDRTACVCIERVCLCLYRVSGRKRSNFVCYWVIPLYLCEQKHCVSGPMSLQSIPPGTPKLTYSLFFTRWGNIFLLYSSYCSGLNSLPPSSSPTILEKIDQNKVLMILADI